MRKMLKHLTCAAVTIFDPLQDETDKYKSDAGSCNTLIDPLITYKPKQETKLNIVTA